MTPPRRATKQTPTRPRRHRVAGAAHGAAQGECILFTVTFYANPAHNLTRSPWHICFSPWSSAGERLGSEEAQSLAVKLERRSQIDVRHTDEMTRLVKQQVRIAERLAEAVSERDAALAASEQWRIAASVASKVSSFYVMHRYTSSDSFSQI